MISGQKLRISLADQSQTLLPSTGAGEAVAA